MLEIHVHAPMNVNTGYISDASVDKFKKLLSFPKIIEYRLLQLKQILQNFARW